MVRSLTERLGAPDILINNAGTALIRGINDLTEADLDKTISVNLKSAFLCTQAVLPNMRSAGAGAASSTFPLAQLDLIFFLWFYINH
jgi:NAD(P)-dependent dehydrogenase (short-subunit alcohol dehydrogenase family)